MSGKKKIKKKVAEKGVEVLSDALDKIAKKLRARAKKVKDSVDPSVAAAVAGLGAISQTDQMQSIGSAAIDVTGSSREKGDSFIESYIPGFRSDRVKNMSADDRMAEINDYEKRRRAKNKKGEGS